MFECPICCEKYTKIKNRPITCKYCDYTACFLCIKNYLLKSNQYAHCLNCKNEWNYDSIRLILPPTFINRELREHRENLLYEREKSLLVQTQIELEIEDKIKTLNNKKKKILSELDIISERITKDKRVTDDDDLRIDIYKVELFEINSKLKELESNDSKKQKKKFIRKCPKYECNGFLSTKWKCGLCKSKVCNKCFDIMPVSSKNKTGIKLVHVCKKENVETTKLLLSETKSCPSCGTLIYKIEGCDQMWCTICKTPFSWSTGEVQLKLHNPHYYEWLRSSSNYTLNDKLANKSKDIQSGGEIECNYLPFIKDIEDKLKENGFNGFSINMVYEHHREIVHHQEESLPHFRYDNADDSTKDLRVAFLRGKINENYFKSMLQKREKARYKNKCYYDVLDVYIQVSCDLFRSILSSDDPIKIKEYLHGLDQITQYFDDRIHEIASYFGTEVPSRLIFA